MSDSIEALGYFSGAWLFIFSKRFRNAWLEEFVGAGKIGRVFMTLDAGVSVALGFGLPIALLVWAFK
jgi:hypothetical protein